jgi:hypothetical protein
MLVALSGSVLSHSILLFIRWSVHCNFALSRSSCGKVKKLNAREGTHLLNVRERRKCMPRISCGTLQQTFSIHEAATKDFVCRSLTIARTSILYFSRFDVSSCAKSTVCIHLYLSTVCVSSMTSRSCTVVAGEPSTWSSGKIVVDFFAFTGGVSRAFSVEGCRSRQAQEYSGRADLLPLPSFRFTPNTIAGMRPTAPKYTSKLITIHNGTRVEGTLSHWLKTLSADSSYAEVSTRHLIQSVTPMLYL